jgi:thiamine biosynthesis lipoprotein
VSFDLSSIAKGYAVDRLVRLLDVPDVSSCLVEIGGELRARGVKPNGEPWWVAVEIPPDLIDGPEVLIALCNLSVASSGDYRRYFDHGGRRYSHTIDPRTGSPVRHAIASVTVVHPECMLADACSTALAVMGPEAGLAFADRTGLAAQFVVRDGASCRVYSSRSFTEMLA